MRTTQTFKCLVLIASIISLALLVHVLTISAENKNELITLFPIENYDQNISHWIKSTDKDYDQALLTPKQLKMRKDGLYIKYFGERSPWSESYINQILTQPFDESLQKTEQDKINSFDNSNKNEDQKQYGQNFIAYSSEWIKQIKYNMNIQQFDGAHFEPQRRGIAIDNLQGRILPTDDVAFNSHKIAGQGYPFDNLQAVMILAGTPVYILGKTRDLSWSLVQAPNFIAWVKSNGVAIVDNQFVNAWQIQAQKSIAALTQTKISIMDMENKSYRFTGYIGMLFPAISHAEGIRIAIPVADSNQHAKIYYAQLSHQQAVIMPLLPTPHHFTDLMQQLINRPYGWGGMNGYNDCSSELKNLFIPFGILLPSYSTSQVDPEIYAVRQIDLSKLNSDERMSWLSKHGHKFMTIVYIGGHVFLYLGNYVNPNNPEEKVILTYQEMWGLKPKDTIAHADSRSIIGKSVLFPLLKVYPENTSLASQAEKPLFQLGVLE